MKTGCLSSQVNSLSLSYPKYPISASSWLFTIQCIKLIRWRVVVVGAGRSLGIGVLLQFCKFRFWFPPSSSKKIDHLYNRQFLYIPYVTPNVDIKKHRTRKLTFFWYHICTSVHSLSFPEVGNTNNLCPFLYTVEQFSSEYINPVLKIRNKRFSIVRSIQKWW